MGNKSIIQSTLIKITVLIFTIFIATYFAFVQMYWDKEVVKRQFNLLSIASSIQLEIQSNYTSIKEIKDRAGISQQEKAEYLHKLLDPMIYNYTTKHSGSGIGYYDSDLNLMVASSGEDSLYLNNTHTMYEFFATAFHSKDPEFIADRKAVNWDGKGIIAVTVPVYYQNDVVGYALAKVNANSLLYLTSFQYSKVLIISILLWLLVVYMVKRNIIKIGTTLDTFAQTITENKFDHPDLLNQLPELKPVFEKIQNHMGYLHELNTQLERSNDKLITIMHGITDGFFALDKEGRFTFVNDETKKLAGKEHTDLIGRTIWEEFIDGVEPTDLNNIRQAMDQNTPMHWESKSPSNNRYLGYSIYPFSEGITVFVRDITGIKRQEEELARLERLNLIGQMAAGISHEVRNPMTTVRGFLQIMENRSNSEQDKDYMELMISEIDRANGIITDFLSLAKANSESREFENLNDIINRIYPMLQADAFNCNMDLEINLGTIPDLLVNESEIRQIILNLVRNGLEASSEGDKVSICTSFTDRGVILSISDRGPGLPQEVIDKLGTPFVTTKDTGTGLGLAISMGIAHRHDAQFEFETSENGTTFNIIFPLGIGHSIN